MRTTFELTAEEIEIFDQVLAGAETMMLFCEMPQGDRTQRKRMQAKANEILVLLGVRAGADTKQKSEWEIDSAPLDPEIQEEIGKVMKRHGIES